MKMVNPNSTPEELWAEVQRLQTENNAVKNDYVKDFAEYKMLQEAYRDSELKYRSLIENSSDVVFCVNERGEYKFTNQVFASTLGQTPEYFIGKTFWDVYPKEHADHRQAASSKVFETGQVQSVEVTVPLPDRTLYYLAKANPIRDDNGKVILNLTTATDITERKVAEAQVAEKNKELIELNHTKDKLFSIIAHDLKSPFSGFLRLTKILSEEFHSIPLCEMKEFSITLQKSASNLCALLSNLLDWSRMQRGLIQFHPESCIPAFMANQIIEINADAAQNKQITITNSIPDNYNLIADVAMLNTALRNLISNAIKYTLPNGRIEIGIVLDKYECQFFVADSGIGIAPDMMSKLFRIDEKITSLGTDGESGTGLGLVLVKEFVEKHGGKIWAESEVDKGSTFYFTLPIRHDLDLVSQG